MIYLWPAGVAVVESGGGGGGGVGGLFAFILPAWSQVRLRAGWERGANREGAYFRGRHIKFSEGNGINSP